MSGVENATGYAPIAVYDAIYGRCQPDSIIPLGSRRPGPGGPDPYPRYLCPVRVSERDELLPGIFDYHIQETQFLIFNTLSPKCLHRYKRENALVPASKYRTLLKTGRPEYFHAANEHIRELVGLVVDLDVGREPGDLTAGQALGMAVDMTLDGVLPCPSLAALSGRGAYLIWLLSDGTPEQRPPLNTADRARAWRLCVDRLLELPEQLKADAASAHHLAHWYKSPGSVDTRTGRKVIYTSFSLNGWATGLSDIARYTLPALMEILHVTHATLETPAPETIIAPVARPDVRTRQRTAPRKRPGHGVERHSAAAYEIERISQGRAGITEGCRNYAIFYYHQAVLAVKRNHYKGTENWYTRATIEAHREAEKLNWQFRPPLEHADFMKACQPGRRTDGKLRFPRAATIAAHLHVTEKEALDLGLQLIVPAALKAKRKADETARKAKRKKDRTEVQAAIDAAIKNGRRDWTAIGRPHGKKAQYVRGRWLRLQKLNETGPTPLIDGQQ